MLKSEKESSFSDFFLVLFESIKYKSIKHCHQFVVMRCAIVFCSSSKTYILMSSFSGTFFASMSASSGTSYVVANARVQRSTDYQYRDDYKCFFHFVTPIIKSAQPKLRTEKTHSLTCCDTII